MPCLGGALRVCMCTHIYKCVCLRGRRILSTRPDVSKGLLPSIYIYICIHMHINICIYIHINICICIYKTARLLYFGGTMWVYVCVCVCGDKDRIPDS